MRIETENPVAEKGTSSYNVRKPALVSRIRVQLGLGLVMACVLPWLVRIDMGFASGLTSTSQRNSLIATIFAVTAGYVFVRRLNKYPGISNISYILPVFAVTYAMALSVILLFRLDYSRFFLLFSFATVQVWFHFIVTFAERYAKMTFEIVPIGNANKLATITGVEWKMLMQPHLDGAPTHGVVADLRADMPAKWESFIAESAVNGVPVYHYKQLSEDLTGKVEIEHLSENNLGSLLPNFFYLRFKQTLDIAGVILFLPLAVPLFVLIALAIKKDSPGPVFFRQERIGYRGRVFRVWKFRTMEHHAADAESERETFMTAEKDKRITRLGHFLRKSRLDELPQIFNIFLGEMSWIGPRPEALALSRWYESAIPFYRYRHIVRPGITGWAQVNQGHVADVDDVRAKLHFDFYYIKNFSVWLDILITMRTIATMVTGFGAR
ncbi:MAG: sugar transferase [Pseudomonadota bacterium]